MDTFRSTYVVYPGRVRRSVVTRVDGSQFTVFADGEDDVWMVDGLVEYIPTRDPLLAAILGMTA